MLAPTGVVLTTESVRPFAGSPLHRWGRLSPAANWRPPRASPTTARNDSPLDVIPLVFGESTMLSESTLDVRGRRLMHRLERAGLASIVRHETRDGEGSYRVSYSFHLRDGAPAAPPIIQRAADEVTAIYDCLPELAWQHSKN